MLKVLTIGSSTITDTMREAIAMTPGIVHTAVYSRDPARAAAYAARCGVSIYGTDKAALMADDNVNTVYVASPNSCHYADARLALLSGCHVIVEKPFTDTPEEAAELFALAEERRLFLMEAISTIHMPVFAAVRSWLGRIGTVTLASFNYSQYSSRYTAYQEGHVTNVFDPAFRGGALRDINIYNLHVMTALFGRPLTASYGANRGFNGVDTSGIVTADYGSMKAVCLGSKDCNGDDRVSIQGTLGRIAVTDAGNRWHSAELILRDGTRESVSSDPTVNRLTYETADFTGMTEKGDRAAYEALKKETLDVMALLAMAEAS